MTHYSPPGLYRIPSEEKKRAPQIASVVLMVMVLASISTIVQLSKQSYAGPQLSNKFEGGRIYVLKAIIDRTGSLVVLVSNNEEKAITVTYAYIMDTHGKVVTSAKTLSKDGCTIPPGEMRFVYFKLQDKIDHGVYVVEVMSQGMGSGFTSLYVPGR